MPLPWGRMQGVRPSKPFHQLLDRGLTYDEASAEMQHSYGVSDDKMSLLRQVAHAERPIITQIAQKSVSIYVGIPFCPTRCLYCSFPAHSLAELGRERQRFVRALVEEIRTIGSCLARGGWSIDSVYVGGGTPTALSPVDLRTVLTALTNHLPSPWREFTVEAGRPETLTDLHLQVMAEAKVGRISINPQTKHQATLELIGRMHRAEDIEAAYHRAAAIFETINMDLILGLPGESADQARESLDWVLGLRPQNITLHMFSPKRASLYSAKEEDWQQMLPNAILAGQMVQNSYQELSSHGYQPYYLYRQRNILGGQENVGWCLPGHESRYNVLMIEERQHILGLGGGASSKFINKDLTLVGLNNPKNLLVYLDRVEQLIAQKVAMLAERS